MTSEPLPPPAAPVGAPTPGTEQDPEDVGRVSSPDDGIPSFDGEESADVEAGLADTFNPDFANFSAEH